MAAVERDGSADLLESDMELAMALSLSLQWDEANEVPAAPPQTPRAVSDSKLLGRSKYNVLRPWAAGSLKLPTLLPATLPGRRFVVGAMGLRPRPVRPEEDLTGPAGPVRSDSRPAPQLLPDDEEPPRPEDDTLLALALARCEEAELEDQSRSLATALGVGHRPRAMTAPETAQSCAALAIAFQGEVAAREAAASGAAPPVAATEETASAGSARGSRVDGRSHERRLPREQRGGSGPDVLDQLPTRRAGAADCQARLADQDAECAVCCEAYQRGDELRTLPCLHAFHKQCIDQWITGGMPGARSCPVCHTHIQA